MKVLLLLTSVGFALISTLSDIELVELVSHLPENEQEEALATLMTSEEQRNSPVLERLFEEEGDLEEEEEDDELEADGVLSDLSYVVDSRKSPRKWDNRKEHTVHGAIYQGGCPSCGWVSGTQTLEARIGIVSENYIPYSIQHFMNCYGKICYPMVPYAVQGRAKNWGVIVPEQEVPYTRKDCIEEGNGTMDICSQRCALNSLTKYTNALLDQFVFIAGTRKAGPDEAGLKRALLSGPVTTCFTRKGEGVCRRGCTHATSIVGYTKDSWIVQENAGERWGKFKDGSFTTPFNTTCGNALIPEAYYPHIIYDYDRANAYYTPIEGGVNSTELRLVELDKTEWDIATNTTKNWGTAKNKCAFIGASCKGVAEIDGVFELVADFGAQSAGPSKGFKKTQMVQYIRNEETGKYIGITKKKKLVLTWKAKAAPFFSSYSRLISFDFPHYHVVNNTLEKIVGGVRDINLLDAWTLSSCNINNPSSGLSLAIALDSDGIYRLKNSTFDKASQSQRFNVGVSGNWTLTSTSTSLPLSRHKAKGVMFSKDSNNHAYPLHWMARQVITRYAKPLLAASPGQDFKFGDTKSEVRAVDCGLTKLFPDLKTGDAKHLVVKAGKLGMSDSIDSINDTRWTFEPADL